MISVLRGSPPTLPLFLLLSSHASSPGISLCFLCPLTIPSSWSGSISPERLSRVQLKVQLRGTTANPHFHLFSFPLAEKEGNFWVSRTCQLPFLTKWLRRLFLPNYPRIECQNNSGCWEIHWESMTVNVTSHNYWGCTLEPASHDYEPHSPQLGKARAQQWRPGQPCNKWIISKWINSHAMHK